ncbi:murein biosynthesis integral membrane protein MurJ [Glycomyces arizonensis]|uniref:murein biosynthesis integral membrane protein MurJ n=1 Tax=Glycomyces arizonensis TaxID=256035 RepID=UPI000407409D|nr:lipid II flippase MurJ [Glycomyces arizonensis]
MTDTRREVGRAATLIGAITIGSRLAGFGRVLVFTGAVGYSSLGTAYQNANTVPNLIFELVAGGALAALAVPLLSAPLARHDADQVNRIASALLTWSLAVLIPIAAAVALLARPLVELVSGPHVTAATIDTGTEMLVLFAPQLPLYGIAVVLTGVLQSHRKFAWPALAPLLSSITMIAVYVAYGFLTDSQSDAARVSQSDLLLLALGTTLGVAVLAGCLFIPLRRLGLRLRPTWKFDAHLTASVKALAIAGVITLGAQQLCQFVLLRLANGAGDGPVVVFTVSQTFFLLPWAILAVPFATAAYPNLSEAHALGDTPAYQRTIAAAGRVVLVLSGLGVTALAGVAEPIANVLGQVQQHAPEAEISATLAGLAFGLFGYSMFAVYSRGLYAVDRAYAAAAATAAGWGTTVLSAVILSAVIPIDHRTTALAISWSIGMTVTGIALTAAVARNTGAASLKGLGRSLAAALSATVVAIAAARVLIGWWGHAGSIASAVSEGVAAGAVAALVYVGVAALVDHRAVLRAVRRRAGTIRPSEEAEQSGEDQ